MLIEVITAPPVEPVTAADIKEHLRIDHSSHDGLLEGLIQASREWVENVCGRSLVEQTRAVYYQDWPDNDRFELPYPPIQSVTSLVYTDADGTENTFSSSNYSVITNREPGLLVLGYQKVWPTATIHNEEWPIKITYVSGYEATTDSPIDYRANIPAGIINAIKLDVERRYDRPPENYARRLDEVIDDLLATHKIRRF